MEQLLHYVNPELLIVAVVLYFIGTWIKGSERIKDKYIPLILGELELLCVQFGYWLQTHAVMPRKSLWQHLRPLCKVYWWLGLVHT